MTCVVDASFVASLLLPDENTSRSADLIRRMAAGGGTMAPCLLQFEVTNILLSARRRRRIDSPQLRILMNAFDDMPITLQPVLSREERAEVVRLAEKHHLTAYDAAYLELAMRLGLPLASLDEALVKAAKAEGTKLAI